MLCKAWEEEQLQGQTTLSRPHSPAPHRVYRHRVRLPAGAAAAQGMCASSWELRNVTLGLPSASTSSAQRKGGGSPAISQAIYFYAPVQAAAQGSVGSWRPRPLHGHYLQDKLANRKKGGPPACRHGPCPYVSLPATDCGKEWGGRFKHRGHLGESYLSCGNCNVQGKH